MPRRRTKVPITNQVAQTECGLCCARSLLAYHGRDLPLHTLRAECEPGRDGLSMRQIAELLRSHGLSTRMFRVHNSAAVLRLQAPHVAFWEEHHFVVVERATASSVLLMDPMSGRRDVDWEEFVERFSGVVLLAEPTDRFIKVKRSAMSSWRNKPLLPAGIWRQFFLLIVLSISLLVVTVSIPVLTERFVDRIVSQTLDTWTSLSLVAAAAVCYGMLEGARAFTSISMTRLVTIHLIGTAFARLLRLPFRYFLSRPPGELMFRLGSLGQVQEILTDRVVQYMLDATTLVVLLGYLYWTAPIIGAVVSIMLFVIMLIIWGFQGRIRRLVDEEVQFGARAQGVQMDALVSIGNIRLRGYGDDFYKDWFGTFESSVRAMTRRAMTQQGLVGSALSSLQVFGPIVTIVVAGSLTIDGAISIGMAVAAQGVATLLFSVGVNLGLAVNEITVVTRFLERTDDIFETEPEPDGGTVTALTEASVRLKDVSFRYGPLEPLVLRNIDIEVGAAEHVALVGPSGSGKSTVAKLMTTLYQPTLGRVEFGGLPVDQYSLSALRRHLGYVPQDGYLHNRSIADNLVLGTDLEPEVATSMCSQWSFLDFVDELPMGYHTVVANMGSNISGGQRQRILIARALLTDPSILILDEATAALDNVSQASIFAQLRQRCTATLIVAHRLSSLTYADRIYVMDQGQVVESGTHLELMARGGLYSELFALEEG